MAKKPTILIKRYSNRRLYDTDKSSYITMAELAERIRKGSDVRVVDAKTNEDLTQATLTQIIIEGRGAGRLLPIPLLIKLIRLGDDALAEFFGRYMSVSLELYLQLKRGAQAVQPYYPFATLPFDASSAFARMLMGASHWVEPSRRGAPASVSGPEEESLEPMQPMEPPPPMAPDPEVAELRRELDELKAEFQKKKR